MYYYAKWCLTKIPVCGGVVCDPCVGVGGGVEVGKTTDVKLPSGKPVEDYTEHKPLCLLLATWANSPITAVINGRYRRFIVVDRVSKLLATLALG